MDNKKKYIIAIVLFVFLGLMVFTFANPGEEEEKLDGNKTEQQEQVADEENETNIGDNENAGANNEQQNQIANQGAGVPVVLADNSYDLALEAVINAEEKIDEDSYDAAVDLVNKVTNNDQKETLEERLEEVKDGIDAKALVEELTKRVETSENKENLDGARDFRTDEEVVEKVNALANEDLKEELQNQLATLALLLDDTTAPVVKDENGEEITNEKILSKTAKLLIEDENAVVATISEEGSNESNELGDDYTAGEGTYTLTLRDEAFNEKVVTFTIDLSAPEINVVNKSHSTGNIDVVITDATFKYVEIYNQDAKTKELSTKSTFTLEGDATYRLTAYDETGRKTVVWTAIDSVYPTISGVGNKVHYDKKEIKITVEDKFLMNLEVTGPDGTELFTRTDFTVGKNKEDYSYVYTATKEGTYTIVATDKAGNATTVTFTIDRTNPVLTNVVNGGYYQSVTPGVIEENFKNATLKLNGKTIKTYTVGDTLTEEGTYTLVVTDKAMNKSNNGAITFVVDSTPAEISVSMSNNDGKWSTNQDVIATLKSNEVINTPEEWTVVTEGLEFTKVYTDNEKVSFEVTDLAGNVTPVSFEVKRIDRVKPTLTIINPEKYQLEVHTDFVDPGYSAYDVIDKDVTKLVKKAYKFQAKGTDTWEEVDSIDTTKLGTYEIIYTAYDKAGNTDTGSRQVEIVDTTAPVITLNGDNPIYLNEGEGSYVESYATLTDNYDATITDLAPAYINFYELRADGNYHFVSRVASVNINVPGRYNLVYYEKDSQGNEAVKVTRLVFVKAKSILSNNLEAILNEVGKENIATYRVEWEYKMPTTGVVKSWDISSEQDGSVMAWITGENKYTIFAQRNLYGNADYSRDEVESINMVASSEVPSNAIDSWDISSGNDEAVKVWLTDTNNNGLYELYMGQNGGVIAPKDASYLFYSFDNVTTIDVTNLNTSKTTDMRYMFAAQAPGAIKSNLESIKGLDKLDTSNVTDMSYMFNRLKSLKTLDLSNFDTSKVTNMSNMFDDCYLLTTLDVSNFNTSNVTNMSGMFSDLENLKSLDLSNFDTKKVTNMSGMFESSKKLTSINLSSFNTTNVTDMSAMFRACDELGTIDLSNIDTTNVTNIHRMFDTARKINATITIKNKNAKGTYVAYFTAEKAGAKLTLNYTSETEAIVDAIIANRHSGDNIVKGSLVD